MSKILFKNCSVLDTTSGQLLYDYHVLVEDSKILELSDKPIKTKDPLSINVDGRVLMPGLIDIHVHPTITTMNIASTLSKPVTLVMQLHFHGL